MTGNDRAFVCQMTAMLWLLAGLIYTQGYKATLTGRVTDSGGAAINGASVTATCIDTNVATSSRTDAAGSFTITQLVPGRYQLQVEAAGFRNLVRAGITLQVDQTARVDVALEPGPLTDEVIIREDAPPIATDSSSLGEVISGHEIEDIPLNGRDYLDLARLAPGVVPSAAGAGPFNINGARSDHVNYLLDGFSNISQRGHEPVVAPSLDAIQEFKIITSNFSAEYGRLGGGVISVALRGGTRQFHGSLFEFLRNDALDARGFFDPEVPELKRHQFGGMLSGPLDRRRTFFLFSYEGLRNREEKTRLTRVPTDAERVGNFAAPVKNPFTGKPFAANTIAPELINPIAARILSLIPKANRTGTLNFMTVQPVTIDRNSYLTRVDHYLGKSGLISGRMLLNNSDSRDPFRSTPLPGFGATRETVKQLWALSYTHGFSARLSNEARVGFLRDNLTERSVNAGKNTSAEVGLTGVANGYGLANIVIAGFPEAGDASFLPDEWTDNEYVFSDTVNWLPGAHNLRMGFDFQRAQHFNLFAAFAGGQLVSLGNFTGNALADFLLGLTVQTERQVGTNKNYLFNNYFGFFVQDDWKVRHNLTLNLGVRYDLNQPPTEKYNRYSNFVPGLRRLVRPGEQGFSRALVNTDLNNFSPRVGFAWRPFGNERTAIRGGYGIFSSTDLQFTMYTLLGANAHPFTRLEVFQDLKPGGLTLSKPFPADRTGAAPVALSPSGWDVANPSSDTQHWNLTIAHELTGNMGLELSYVGSKGTHLSATRNLNQTIRTPQGNIVPYPGLGRVLFQSLGASSNYHALQLSVSRRFSHGPGFRSSLTWSKAIDNATFGAPARLAQNPLDQAAERGLAEFDRRLVWSSDFIYQLPFGRGQLSGAGLLSLLRALAGGWQVSGIIHVYSGRPFTPVVARANAQAGFATRPDRIRNGRLDHPTIERWFDPTAFVEVPAGAFRFGNSGRNILIGPGAVLADAALMKNFSLPREGQRLEFRAEFFNLPNHANFGQPSAAIDQPTAGVISTAGAGRQIQLALKYLF
ncbi:MAG: TonB-dependent receptor [Blastocatellia bacterium]